MYVYREDTRTRAGRKAPATAESDHRGDDAHAQSTELDSKKSTTSSLVSGEMSDDESGKEKGPDAAIAISDDIEVRGKNRRPSVKTFLT